MEAAPGSRAPPSTLTVAAPTTEGHPHDLLVPSQLGSDHLLRLQLTTEYQDLNIPNYRLSQGRYLKFVATNKSGIERAQRTASQS